MDITPAIRSFVYEKFDRLQRHFDHITNIHVILTVEKDRHKAEATVHVNRGSLFAESENDDMYAAIDSLIDKLDRQILKHKDKLNRHKVKSA
jgi:putative sigma-54 modulation protein